MQRSGVRRGCCIVALLFREQNAVGKLLKGTLFRNLIPDMTGWRPRSRGTAGLDAGAAPTADECALTQITTWPMDASKG